MGSEALYRSVRAGFVAKGLTLNRWCQQHQYSRQYVAKCLQGRNNGPGAKTLVKRVAKAAGVGLARPKKSAVPAGSGTTPTTQETVL